MGARRASSWTKAISRDGAPSTSAAAPGSSPWRWPSAARRSGASTPSEEMLDVARAAVGRRRRAEARARRGAAVQGRPGSSASCSARRPSRRPAAGVPRARARPRPRRARGDRDVHRRPLRVVLAHVRVPRGGGDRPEAVSDPGSARGGAPRRGLRDRADDDPPTAPVDLAAPTHWSASAAGTSRRSDCSTRRPTPPGSSAPSASSRRRSSQCSSGPWSSPTTAAQ